MDLTWLNQMAGMGNGEALVEDSGWSGCPTSWDDPIRTDLCDDFRSKRVSYNGSLSPACNNAACESCRRSMDCCSLGLMMVIDGQASWERESAGGGSPLTFQGGAAPTIP